MSVEFEGNLVSIDRPNNSMTIYVNDELGKEHALIISSVDKSIPFSFSFLVPILRGTFAMSPSEIDSSPHIDSSTAKHHKIRIRID